MLRDLGFDPQEIESIRNPGRAQPLTADTVEGRLPSPPLDSPSGSSLLEFDASNPDWLAHLPPLGPQDFPDLAASPRPHSLQQPTATLPDFAESSALIPSLHAARLARQLSSPSARQDGSLMPPPAAPETAPRLGVEEHDMPGADQSIMEWLAQPAVHPGRFAPMPLPSPVSAALLPPAVQAAAPAAATPERLRADTAADAARHTLQHAGFSAQQIKSIQKYRGGELALLAVADHWAALTGLGLNLGHITKIASNVGGARAIRTVLQHLNTLRSFGLSQEAITKIAGNKGGTRAMEALLAQFNSLQSLGLSKQEITKIASNLGGAQAIAAVSRYFPTLQQHGLSAMQIAGIAGNAGGARAIQAVLRHSKSLHALGLSTAQICRIAGHLGGAQAIAAVREHFNALQARSLSLEQIVRIASSQGGGQAIPALIRHFDTLRANGHSLEDITCAASMKDGCKRLETLANRAPGRLQVVLPQPGAHR